MRDSGLVSTGPHSEKSTAGMVGNPPPPGARAPAGAGAAAGAANALFTKPLMSSWVIRPLNPLPLTRVRSTPSARANLRTDGPAWACEKPGSLMGGRPVETPAGLVAAVAPLETGATT